MIKVIKQIDAGKNTLLILNSHVPQIIFDKIVIEGKEYEPVVAYDIDNAIGIVGHGIFEGKELIFS